MQSLHSSVKKKKGRLFADFIMPSNVCVDVGFFCDVFSDSLQFDVNFPYGAEELKHPNYSQTLQAFGFGNRVISVFSFGMT